ncbi:hypothetical protein ABT160_36980 [Streptomyces sp. NPDC001941]|uniref:hypothetical protein n=1 Tax=Streptomyces sp. NPDC001941 TaxID=3154659 RepID=UPI00331B515E
MNSPGTALRHSARAVAVVLAALSATALAAPAQAATTATTVSANSSLRAGPSQQFTRYGVTAAADRVRVECYYHGQDVNQGGRHTDVWYRISSGRDSRVGDLSYMWTWGGNTSLTRPPSGMPLCHFE